MGDMGLITPGYRDLQMRLHAQGNYGKGVDVAECAALIRSIAPRGASVLDYGCGQGHLKRELTEYDVREYDPCIDGKDGRPERADYVVCADVLEHIEPDCLDNLIGHLTEVTGKRLIVVIATRPSGKKLADGRNAHLIVENAEWWKDRLFRFFRFERWEDRHEQGHGILGVLEPSVVISGKLKAIGVLSDNQRNEYVKINVTRTPRRIPQVLMQPHGTFAILCGYGPSLRDSFQHIAEQKKVLPNAQIITTSGAHDYLRKRHIQPDWHIECDPRMHKSRMIKRLCDNTKYLMASCCHPDFIKRIANCGNELLLWHLFNGEASYKIRDIPGEQHEALIPGGGSIMLRGMVLLYFLGYRNFVIHGFDCSFANGYTHAAGHTGKKLNRVKVRVEGTERWFETAPMMVSYAEHMLNDFKDGRYPNCKFHFMGDGLFQTMLKQYIESPKEPAKPNYGRDYFSMQEGDSRPNETWSNPNKEIAA